MFPSDKKLDPSSAYYKALAYDLYMAFTRPSNRRLSFRAQLFNLLKMADSVNRKKLAKGFPHEYQVYMDWYEGGDEWDRVAKRLWRADMERLGELDDGQTPDK